MLSLSKSFSCDARQIACGRPHVRARSANQCCDLRRWRRSLSFWRSVTEAVAGTDRAAPRTSSMTSNFDAETFRAGAIRANNGRRGCIFPLSIWLMVVGWQPHFSASSAWVRPTRSRRSRRDSISRTLVPRKRRLQTYCCTGKGITTGNLSATLGLPILSTALMAISMGHL